MAVFPTIRIAQQGQQEYVPRLAVTLGTVLVALSLALLVFFIHRLTTSTSRPPPQTTRLMPQPAIKPTC